MFAAQVSLQETVSGGSHAISSCRSTVISSFHLQIHTPAPFSFTTFFVISQQSVLPLIVVSSQFKIIVIIVYSFLNLVFIKQYSMNNPFIYISVLNCS